MQLPGWRPMVWLGCAAVPVERPVLGLVLLRVPGSVQPWVPALVRGARPLLGLLLWELLQQGMLRWVLA